MTALKIWLKTANGWQRIWFIGTVTGLLYGCFLFPFEEASKNQAYEYDRARNIYAEMKRPECAPYMSQPFNQLKDPAYSTDTGCYFIYTHRQYEDKNPPVTQQSYADNSESEYRKKLLILLGVGLFVATVLSASVYGAGSLVAWVIKGFRN